MVRTAQRPSARLQRMVGPKLVRIASTRRSARASSAVAGARHRRVRRQSQRHRVSAEAARMSAMPTRLNCINSDNNAVPKRRTRAQPHGAERPHLRRPHDCAESALADHVIIHRSTARHRQREARIAPRDARGRRLLGRLQLGCHAAQVRSWLCQHGRMAPHALSGNAEYPNTVASTCIRRATVAIAGRRRPAERGPRGGRTAGARTYRSRATLCAARGRAIARLCSSIDRRMQLATRRQTVQQ